MGIPRSTRAMTLSIFGDWTSMYSEHPNLTLPEATTKLMRYMSYAKFADLLYRKALYFPVVNSLSDQYEGTLPHSYSLLDLPSNAYGGEVMQNDMYNIFRRFREIYRRRTMISSWCLSEHESISMWERYSNKEGVAISTNVSSLKSAFIGNDDIYIGEVRYIDYDRDRFTSSEHPSTDLHNSLIPFIHKRKEYSDEREIRAIAIDHILSELQEAFSRDATFDNEKNYVPSELMYQSVNLKVLIQEVIVSPDAGDWLTSLVRYDLAREGIDVPVSRSTMVRVPNY